MQIGFKNYFNFLLIQVVLQSKENELLKDTSWDLKRGIKND